MSMIGRKWSSLIDSDLDACWSTRKRARIIGGEFTDEPAEHCSIDSLPDECLFEIFRRLSGPQERSVSACVSRRWLSLLSSVRAAEICAQKSAADGSAVLLKKPLPDLNGEDGEDLEEEEGMGDDVDGGHLTRSLEEQEATDVRLAAMAVGTAGRGGLGKLLIRGSNPTRGVTDKGLSAIARGCPSLRILALWKVPFVTDAGLADVAAGCPLLEKISLCECPLISDVGLKAVAESCPNLTGFAVERCSGIKNEGLQAIGRRCAKLESVSVTGCPNVGDAGIAGMVSSASSSLMKIKLHNLSISDASLAVIGYYGRAVTDLTLNCLQNVGERGFWVMGNALGLQKLKNFNVTSCRGVTDLGLQAVAMGCPSLRMLCLRRCCFLSDAGLKAFVDAAKVLESLQLEECNRISLVGVLGGLSCNSNLKALSLVKCMGIKDVSFCSTQLELPLCRSLRSLTIRDCPGFTSCSLAFVGKICPKLQQFDLSGLIGVTDEGVLSLIQGTPSRLVKVTLNGCINLTDAVVFALVKAHGETLQLLHLNGCINITDRSLLAISDSCYRLNDIDLSRCDITDYGVAALASARQLDMRMLSFVGCSKLTEKCLPLLGNMGESLVGLNLQRCNLISAYGIDFLEAKLWWCDILS